MCLDEVVQHNVAVQFCASHCVKTRTRKEEQGMYAAIRRGKANPGSVNEMTRRIQEGFVPSLRTAPGFVAYSFLDYGNDEVQSITVFETQVQVEAFQKRADDWARQNLASLMQGPPQPSTGEVLIHVAK